MTIKDWKQFTPFYFYTSVTLCLAGAAAMTEVRSPISILLLLLCGFLSWGLVEYALHRSLFHHHPRSESSRRFIYALHLSHHEYPQAVDRLFVGLRMSVPIAACYCLLLWAMLGNWHPVVYLFAGLIAGYFSYEWLHYQAHHGRPRRRLFKYLKKYHLLHHHRTPGLRFGVTSPFFDYLFGTYRPVSNAAPRAAKQMTGSPHA